jgi:hypothetical protein
MNVGDWVVNGNWVVGSWDLGVGSWELRVVPFGGVLLWNWQFKVLFSAAVLVGSWQWSVFRW